MGNRVSADAWKETVVTQTLLGKTPKEIAEIGGKCTKSVTRALKDPWVQEQLESFHSKQRSLVSGGTGIEIIQANKDKLIREMIGLGLESEDENIRLGALKFLLERFPEFRKAGEGGPSVQINYLSQGEAEKVRLAASKLEQMKELFEGGRNPNVMECESRIDTENDGRGEGAQGGCGAD